VRGGIAVTDYNDRDMGYRAQGFPDGTFVMQGKSPEEAPFPPELALGNIVRLNKPYATDRNLWHRIESYGRCRCGFEFQSDRKEYLLHLEDKGFKWGIIAEHVSRNAWGVPVVSLHLYDDEGRLLMGPNSIPEYVDFCAHEFQVWKVAMEMGYAPAFRRQPEDSDA
jgi:hypothetical protein